MKKMMFCLKQTYQGFAPTRASPNRERSEAAPLLSLRVIARNEAIQMISFQGEVNFPIFANKPPAL